LGPSPPTSASRPGLVVDDVHDVCAEVRDHAFGHDRADAFDQA
jgi:hypothetical protein